jgi:cathepsin L
VVSRPHWHYAGRALVPARHGGASAPPREAFIFRNTTRHAAGAKTSSYSVYVDAVTGLPLRFYMVGYNILASSHYDEYLLDFDGFSERDFSAEAAAGDADGKGGEFEVPEACPRGGEIANESSRTLAALRAQAAMAMPWSSVAGGATGPLLQQNHPQQRLAALAYIDAWNERREQELRLLQQEGGNGNANGASPAVPRPLLRPNGLVDLTDEQYAATMTSAAGGLAARRRRAERARAIVAANGAESNAALLADAEDALARAEAADLPPELRRYDLGNLVPTYELSNDGGSNSLGRNHHKKHDHQPHPPHRPLPREVDWRGTAADPGPPADQGTCGSCWAFAASGAMSGAWAVATGQVRALSQQQMVDCAWRAGNNGCGGGWIERAIAYIADHKVSGGAMADELYPYRNVNAFCGDKDAWQLNKDRTPARGGTDSAPPPAVARFRGYAAVRPHDDAALMDAVAHHGPVAVSIDASPLSFKFFGGGVYWSDECGWRPSDLDHAVLVMGYGTTPEGVDYWLIRNSWSALWGDNGFIRVKRGFGVDCGITTAPFVAVVEEDAARQVGGGEPLVPGWRAPVTTKGARTAA